MGVHVLANRRVEAPVSDGEWVTDPDAIRTLVQLGGLQVGDEVRLTKAHNIFIPDLAEDKVQKITQVFASNEFDHLWRHAKNGAATTRKPLIARIECGACVIALENIAAWRRP